MSSRDVAVKVRVDADTSGASSKLSSLGGIAKKAALGVALVAVAVVGAGAKLYEWGDRLDDSNARIENITERMGLFDKQAGAVSERLIKLAEATALSTGVDQNAIKATQAKLLTFKELAKTADDVGGNFDRATLAAIDLAAAGFGTAEGNAAQLGKALNDPVKGLAALAKSGVTFTEQEKARIAVLAESNRMGEAQAIVLKAIETQVGGTAEAMSGGVDRMKIRFSQLGEQLGSHLVPIVDRLANKIVDDVIPGAQRLGAFLADKLGPAFAATGRFITQGVIPAARTFYDWFVEKIAPGIRKYVTSALEGVRTMFGKVREALKDNQPELEKVRAALQKLAEWTAEHVLPKLGDFVKFLTGSVFAKAIVATIDNIARVVNAIDKIVTTIDRAIEAWKSLNALMNGDGAASAGTAPVTGSAGPGREIGQVRPEQRVGPLAVGRMAGVDARTFVTVDGSGIVDEAAVARALEPVLARQRERLGQILPAPMWATA